MDCCGSRDLKDCVWIRKRKRFGGKNRRRCRVRKKAEAPSSASVKFTHVEKVMFPAKGYTKGDLLEYYHKVSRLLLPHLRDRPVTLQRYPDGVRDGAPQFWQKRTPEYYPSWIPRVDIKSVDGTRVNYSIVNDAQTLLYLVNQGAITFHVWLSRIQQPDLPDYVLFDLDPAQRGFADIVKIAKELFKILENEEDVRSCLKTSGKRGLHVLVPWKGDYEKARGWAMSVAQRAV